MAFIQKNILFGDHSEWGWSAEIKIVNKHSKFDENYNENFEIRQLDYDMIHALYFNIFSCWQVTTDWHDRQQKLWTRCKTSYDKVCLGGWEKTFWKVIQLGRYQSILLVRLFLDQGWAEPSHIIKECDFEVKWKELYKVLRF